MNALAFLAVIICFLIWEKAAIQKQKEKRHDKAVKQLEAAQAAWSKKKEQRD